jgi:hypothetical protein
VALIALFDHRRQWMTETLTINMDEFKGKRDLSKKTVEATKNYKICYN